MPIYEYVCKGCKKQFEELILSNDQVACPVCSSEKCFKQISIPGSARLMDMCPPTGMFTKCNDSTLGK